MASLISYSNLNNLSGCCTPNNSILNSTPVGRRPPARSIYFGDVSNIHENSAMTFEDGNETYHLNVTSFASCPDLQLRPFTNCTRIRKKQFGYRCCKTKQKSCSKLQLPRRQEGLQVRFHAATVNDDVINSPTLKRCYTTVGLPPVAPRKGFHPVTSGKGLQPVPPRRLSGKLGLLRKTSAAVKFNKLRRKYSGKLDIMRRTSSSKLDIDTDEKCNLRRFKSLSTVKSPGTHKSHTSTSCVNSKFTTKHPRFNHRAIRTCPIRKSLRITHPLNFSTSANKSFVLTNGLLLTSAITLKTELKFGHKRTCC